MNQNSAPPSGSEKGPEYWMSSTVTAYGVELCGSKSKTTGEPNVFRHEVTWGSVGRPIPLDQIEMSTFGVDTPGEHACLQVKTIHNY